ncbi:hypothetical protein CW748_17025 [Alteromonadales bacterium alter-6D02]|nr:hypothetical protein CW748_17025 [Alteromonadales bacterium alter-6D02]
MVALNFQPITGREGEILLFETLFLFFCHNMSCNDKTIFLHLTHKLYMLKQRLKRKKILAAVYGNEEKGIK